MQKRTDPIRIFSSYSSSDELYRRELEAHLAVLRRAGVVETWNFRQIEAGSDWRRTIDVNLNDASLLLLLVSANFLASEYCWEVEMKRAMDRHERGDAIVVPIIVKDCDWHAAPFAKLQGLPEGGKAVTRWRPRDRGWANVVAGIRGAVESLRRREKRSDDTSTEVPVQGNADTVAPQEAAKAGPQMITPRPELCAEFERRASTPRAVVARKHTRYVHYSIRLYILNAPADAVAASYRLHPSFKPQVRHVDRASKEDFGEWIETYGDFEIHVTFSDSNGFVVGRLSQYLVQALERHYGNSSDPLITEAIDVIRDN